ncbi:MAG: hypothetical protein DRP73_01830 [Candidatus Omnitrophota bacterium]|nr:MAG: hypothetical protein DRP73_01830 [Candidatus Omnitrophota bacterium]
MVGVFENPRDIALWIQQKKRFGLLTRDSALVVLSPYLDFNPDGDIYSDYNWLRFLLEMELVSRVFVIPPSNVVKNHPEWFQCHLTLCEEINKQGYDLNLLHGIKEWPFYVGDVILVIDLAYFRDKVFVKGEDINIVMKILNLQRVLKERNVKIEALLIFSWPKDVREKEAEIILEQILEVFSIK